MPTARCGGTKTFWRVWGNDPPDLLLIHCTLAHSGAWNALASRLDRPAVAFDLPGHGRSGPRDAKQDYLAQCESVAQSFVFSGKVDVVGHSFGAVIALTLALDRPDLVRRLVLIEPVFFAAARGTNAFANHMAKIHPFETAMRAGDRSAAAQMFTGMWGTGVDWDDMREDQRQFLTDQIDLIPAQAGAIFDDNSGVLKPGRLEAMEAPVLLMEGSATEPVIASVTAALTTRLPNTTRCVIEGAGHMLPVTHPTKVADTVLPFLRS